MIGGVAILLMPIPFVFYKYGGPIRERSKFAPTPSPNEEHDNESHSQHRSSVASSSDSSEVTDVGTSSQGDPETTEAKPQESRETAIGDVDRPRGDDFEKDLEKAESRP